MKNKQRNFINHLHPSSASLYSLKPTTTFGLGIACLTCLAVLFITGLTLFLYYIPDQENAYERILHISTTLHFGGLIRNLHYVSANTLIILAVLHMTRVVLTKGYADRWRNWIYGLLMLTFILFSNFTGYLLPWDQVSYWAIKVGSSLASYIPVVGTTIKVFMLGGEEIGHETLLRSFALHAGVIPLFLIILTSLHLWRIRKDGGLATTPEKKDEKVSVSPALYQAEGAVAMLTLSALLLLSIFIDAPIYERADPGHPPNPAKAPWYFVGLQEMVSYSAMIGGVLIPAAIAAFLAFLPKIDRTDSPPGIWMDKKRAAVCLIYLLLLACQLAFIVVGQWFRGKNWQFLWPL